MMEFHFIQLLRCGEIKMLSEKEKERMKIENDIKEFKKRGGRIEKVPIGVSGDERASGVSRHPTQKQRKNLEKKDEI